MIGSKSVDFSLSTWVQGRLTIELISQSIPNNQSVYNAKLYISRKNSETFYYGNTSPSLYMTISGPGYSSSTKNRTYSWNITSTWILIREETVTVTHNANGTPPSSTFYGAITDSFQGWNGNGTVTYTFPTIARASSFTLSGATQTNSYINVTISRKSTAFTHRVRWRVGSGSWTTVTSSATTTSSFYVLPSNMANLKSATITVGVQTYNGTTAIGSEATATRTVTIPNSTISLSGTANTGSAQTVNITNSGGSLTYTRSWKLGSATGGNVASWTPPHSALPSATSGTLTCTVVTKNGTATINTVSATRTITVPSTILPTFTAITHSEYVTNVANLVGAYVQGKSRLTLGVTSPVAGSGSSIKSYSISVAGHKVGNGGTTPVITQSGTLTISATVTDNRNRTATKTTTISVLPYENPSITGVSFTRSDANGTLNTTGTHLTIKATIRVRRLVVSSTEKNKIRYQSQSAQMGGSYTTKTNLADQAGTVSGNYRQVVYTHTHSGYPIDYPYNVRVRGGDIFSWTGYIAGGIPTGVVLQHWGERTTAFGKMIDDVNYNVLVGSKGIKVDGPIVDKDGINIMDHEYYSAVTIASDDRVWHTTPPGYYYIDNGASLGYPASYVLINHRRTGGGTLVFQTLTSNNAIYVRRFNSTQNMDWQPIGVESGSNANGRYIKFSDGTQICRNSIKWSGVAANATADAVWTFPAVFSNIEIPALSITPQNSSTTPTNASILTAGEYSTSANPVGVRGIAVKNTSSATRDITAHLIAIGRWK